MIKLNWNDYLIKVFTFGKFHPVYNWDIINNLENKAYNDLLINKIDLNQFKGILKLIGLNTLNIKKVL